MLRFLTIRILQAIPVLLVMSVITFAIIHAPPGDYGDFIRANMVTQGNATAEAPTPAAAAYRDSTVVNDPLVVQYFRCIWGIESRGDFGQSYAYNTPVYDIMAQRLPPTIAIALVCHLLASLLGIGFGILAAVKQYTWVDTFFSR